MVVVIILVVQQFAQLALRNLQIACQPAYWHAFCGSSVCAKQSADCANSQIANSLLKTPMIQHNIYIYIYMADYVIPQFTIITIIIIM